jgi:hypothetical protein
MRNVCAVIELDISGVPCLLLREATFTDARLARDREKANESLDSTEFEEAVSVGQKPEKT